MSLNFLGGIELNEYLNTGKKPFENISNKGEKRYVMNYGAKPCVTVGEHVLVNTPLGKNEDGFCIYSPVSGEVTSVSDKEIAVCDDGEYEFIPLFDKIERPINEISTDDILGYIKACGITGAFSGVPLYEKLRKSYGKAQRLIVSCVESDPCSGHVRRFCADHSSEIVLGTKLILSAMGIKKAIFAITEKDKITLSAFDKYLTERGMLVGAFVARKYPQGYDRLLISSIYHLEVPFSSDPGECGYLIISAETACNVYFCLSHACCVTEKAMTVSGGALKECKNILARIGTPYSEILDKCGVNDGAVTAEGGIINGFEFSEGYVTPDTNIITAVIPEARITRGCIRCSRCASVCPMHLSPYKLSENALNGMHDKNIEFGLYNCIECGCCSFVCPSDIDILGNIRRDKDGCVDRKGIPPESAETIEESIPQEVIEEEPVPQESENPEISDTPPETPSDEEAQVESSESDEEAPAEASEPDEEAIEPEKQKKINETGDYVNDDDDNDSE